MTHKTATLTIQKWGNSLAVRIPADIARSAHFHLGTVVELDAYDGSLVVKTTARRKLTLNQRITAFDPKIHSGEAMATNPVGWEEL